MKSGANPTLSLSRTVADCIYTPHDPAAHRTLQKFLKDGQYTDSVYLALISRVTAQPLSEGTVASCLDVLQHYLHRYRPSLRTLQQIADCCSWLQSALPQAAGQHRRLTLLQSAVGLYGASTPAAAEGTSRSPGWWPLGASGHTLQPAPTSSRWLGGAAAGTMDAAGPGPLQGPYAGYTAGGAAEQSSLLLWAAQGAVPAWAVPSQPRGLLLSGRLQGADLEDCCLAAWEAGPSITPLLQGFPGMDDSLMLTGRAVQEVVTDAEPAALLTSQEDIVAVRRLQAGVTPDFLAAGWRQCTRSGAGASSSRATGPPNPYTLQEPLSIPNEDVAAVVEVVCGPAQPGAPSAVTGAFESQEEQLARWRVRSNGECLGLQCAAVLLRLMVDTWCRAGSEAAHPLVLALLQQALHQPHPSYRARAFDLLYNLSLHAALLVPGAAHQDTPEGSLAGEGLGSVLSSRPASVTKGRPMSRGVGGPGTLSGGSPAGSSVSDGSPRGAYTGPPSPRGPGAAVAAAAAAAVAAGPGPGASAGHLPGSPASPRSRLGRGDHSRGSSFGQLDPQLLVPPGGQQQQQPAGALDWEGRGSSSPAASWRGVGRLSPGRMSEQQQQQQTMEDGTAVGASRGTSPPGSAVGAEGSQQQATGRPAAAEGPEEEEEEDGGLLVLEFLSWVRELLFDALVMVAQVQEQQEEVWAAAVGCLLQLTTHAGHWVASEVTGLPLQAMQGLLQAAQQYNWSPELYCHLLQLASWLLYQDPAAADTSSSSASSSSTPHSSDGTGPEQGSGGLAGAGGAADGGHGVAAGDGIPRSVQQASAAAGRDPGDFSSSCRVLAGGLVASQLAALGGPAVLVQHLGAAPSPAAQLCCLVPLVHALVPEGTDAAAVALLLEVLAAGPASLAALAAALRSGRPGLADPLLTAASCCHQLDPQLASTVLLQLEDLAVNLLVTGGNCGTAVTHLAAAAGWAQQLEQEVGAAVQVTLQQLAGWPEGAAAGAGQQEAAWAWRALKALCWCSQPAAKEAARQWLQQLLASTLELALAGAIPLPLPAPSGAAASPQKGGGQQQDAAAGGAGAEGLKDVLMHLVTRCPGGPELLLAALELHVSTSKAAALAQQGPTGSSPAPGAAVAAAIGSAAGAAGDSGVATAERARAAAARSSIQGWVLVLQWLLAGNRAHCRAALQELGGLLLRMVSVDVLPPLGSVTASPTVSPSRVTLAGRVRSPSPSKSRRMQPERPTSAALTPVDTAAAGGLARAVVAAEGGEGGGGGLPGSVWSAPLAWHACQHQAFLLGQQEVPEQLAQVLARTPLPDLLSLLLGMLPNMSARTRGLCCRLVSAAEGPPLAPMSSWGGDVALSLLLMLLGAALSDEEGSWQEMGLEGIAAQVLSSCSDPRACHVTARFLLEQLLAAQPGSYWPALRQLLGHAQAVEDERLLGSPFMQLGALLAADGGMGSGGAVASAAAPS